MESIGLKESTSDLKSKETRNEILTLKILAKEIINKSLISTCDGKCTVTMTLLSKSVGGSKLKLIVYGN